MNKKMTTKELTLNAMLIAIIAIMAMIPQLGMISLAPGVTVTIMHIPVIVAGIVLGMKSALITGFAFGLSSLLVVLTRGGGPFDLLFLNPLVSILPRIIFGFVVAGLSVLLSKMMKGKLPFVLNATITAIISTVAHTFVVVTAAYFAIGVNNPAFEGWPTNFIAYLGLFFAVNMLFEIAVAVIIGVPVSVALKRIHR